jgi:hypothetical protein
MGKEERARQEQERALAAAVTKDSSAPGPKADVPVEEETVDPAAVRGLAASIFAKTDSLLVLVMDEAASPRREQIEELRNGLARFHVANDQILAIFEGAALEFQRK